MYQNPRCHVHVCLNFNAFQILDILKIPVCLTIRATLFRKLFDLHNFVLRCLNLRDRDFTFYFKVDKSNHGSFQLSKKVLMYFTASKMIEKYLHNHAAFT